MKDRARFTYAGLGVPIEVEDTTPVRVRWALGRNADQLESLTPLALRRRGPPPIAGERVSIYREGPTCVYLLELRGPIEQLFPELSKGQSVVKVGRSNDPVRRIADLSYGIPPGCKMQWSLAAMRDFPSAWEAHEFEQSLLEKLRTERKWIGGEFAAVDKVSLSQLILLR